MVRGWIMQGIHQFPPPLQNSSHPTTLLHTSAAAAHQSPSSVEPNLGLEPNPQTLTSGQSLIVDRWFNVNNSSKQLIVFLKTLPNPPISIFWRAGVQIAQITSHAPTMKDLVHTSLEQTFDTNYPPKYDFHPLESHFAPNLSFDPSSSFSYFF